MTDLPEMFSPDWETARSEFYAGLFDHSEDDQLVPFDEEFTPVQCRAFAAIWARHRESMPVKFGVTLPRQGDKDKLRAAMKGLHSRILSAGRLLGELLPPGDVRIAHIAEVLSDSGLAASHFIEMLEPYGRADDLWFPEIRQRGSGRRSQYAVERRRLAIGAEIERRVSEGTKQLSVIEEMMGSLGYSEGFLITCVRKWRGWQEAISRFDSLHSRNQE